jgi:mannosidase alpha-like ER degradation enhancer 2
MAAKRATRGIWSRASSLQLVGNHIDSSNGQWVFKESSIGGGVDSFFEYLLKSALYFNDLEYLKLFHQSYSGILKYLKRGPWYIEVDMMTGRVASPVFSSLQAFWPSLQGCVCFCVFFSHSIPLVLTL